MGRYFSPLLVCLQERKHFFFFSLQLLQQKCMHARMFAKERSVGEKSKTWSASRPSKELDMDRRQLLSSPRELQAPDFHTVVKEERRHGPSSPSVMGWFGWFENFHQNQNFVTIVLKESKSETTFFSAGV